MRLSERRQMTEHAKNHAKHGLAFSPLGLRAFNKSGGHEGAKAIWVLALKRSSPAC